MAISFKCFDHLNHFGNVFRCTAHYSRSQKVQLFSILKESIFVKPCDFPYGLFLTTCSFLHLVFSLVCITCEMAYIRDIKYVFYRITVILKCATENIFHDEGAQVTQMYIMVDSWTAGVHADFSFYKRLEQFCF